MAEESEADSDLQRLKLAVRGTVDAGRDLQVRVRELMLVAFSNAGVDLSRMQQVVQAPLEGVDAGAVMHGSASRQAARDAVAGVQDALMQAAEASSLAIREAAGHTSEFARTDLKQAVEELASLEKLFIDTLGNVLPAGLSLHRQAGIK